MLLSGEPNTTFANNLWNVSAGIKLAWAPLLNLNFNLCPTLPVSVSANAFSLAVFEHLVQVSINSSGGVCSVKSGTGCPCLDFNVACLHCLCVLQTLSKWLRSSHVEKRESCCTDLNRF